MQTYSTRLPQPMTPPAVGSRAAAQIGRRFEVNHFMPMLSGESPKPGEIIQVDAIDAGTGSDKVIVFAVWGWDRPEGQGLSYGCFEYRYLDSHCQRKLRGSSFWDSYAMERAVGPVKVRVAS